MKNLLAEQDDSPPICFLFEGVSKTTHRGEKKARHFSDFQIKRTKTKIWDALKKN